MTPASGLVAVQISNVSSHPAVASGTGMWEVALLVIGLALVIHAARGTWSTHQWRTQAQPTQALVVDNIPRARIRRTTWRPLVEFEVDGRTLRSELVSETVQRRALGSAIDILYDPADPRRASAAVLDTSTVKWFFIGLVVVILSVTI